MHTAQFNQIAKGFSLECGCSHHDSFVVYFLLYCADLYVEKMRFEAVKCMARSYRPTVPVSFVARTLGFTGIPGSEGETEGLDECEEWLRGHGSHLQYESGTSELVMDAKVNFFFSFYHT